MEERRRAKRLPAWFPMRLETNEAGDRLAVSRNVSSTGLLMATATKLEVGAPVTLTFRLEAAGPVEHTVSGTIVRFQRNHEDPDGLWPYMVAAVLDEADPALDELLCGIEGGPEEPPPGD